jgi:acyl carrier protein
LPAPDGDAVISRGYEAPHDGTEAILAGLWQDLLQLEQVGRHDHFFELGGHSLIATQLITRINAQFGISVPLKYLYESSTVEKLSEVVDFMLSIKTTQGSTEALCGNDEYYEDIEL